MPHDPANPDPPPETAEPVEPSPSAPIEAAPAASAAYRCVRKPSAKSDVAASKPAKRAQRGKTQKKPKPPKPSKPAKPAWYAAGGLQFTCAWPECRECCQGDEGFIWINSDEVERLAELKDVTPTAFKRQFTHVVMGRRSLIETDAGDCILLGPKGCTVYEDRPNQCLSYPFWPEIISSKKNWNIEAKFCPGIDKGELFDVAEIERRSKLKPPAPWNEL